MRGKIYNKENLASAVLKSFSIRETLKKLGLSPSGGNYESIKGAFKKLGIDTSHFTGQGHLRGKKCPWRKRPLHEILVKGRLENTWRLKNRLLKEGVKQHQCENCGGKKWLGKPTPLELHHLDGDRKNNLLDNLELWCPNCHTLTGNYRGKKNKRVEAIQ